MNTVEETEETICMNWIALQIEEMTGVCAYVEQTGGGVATIFAGELDEEGVPPFAVGPGHFDGPNWTEPHIHPRAMCWGDMTGETLCDEPAEGDDEWAIVHKIAAKIIAMGIN